MFVRIAAVLCISVIGSAGSAATIVNSVVSLDGGEWSLLRSEERRCCREVVGGA